MLCFLHLEKRKAIDGLVMKFKMKVFKDHGDEIALSDPDKEFDSIDRAEPPKKTPSENYARVGNRAFLHVRFRILKLAVIALFFKLSNLLLFVIMTLNPTLSLPS